ncbi:esterase family protein [Nocardia vermiculata]|uniref:Esterase family protein n=2 Tax=Nocardia vermiculata TaxID=257274 RepID=A0A846Y1D1_9NOCA|nr:esterase family protein [Nocardia vermiculata]
MSRAVALLSALTVVAALITWSGGRATAEPSGDPMDVRAPNGSHIHDIRPRDDRILDLGVYSAAMRKVVHVQVLRAADPDRPAPTLYLLNGANGGIGDGSWTDRTDVVDFFAGKQVNVVVPFGGASSYFTDWRADDPVLGRQRWETFLTRELPPIVDSGFGGNGVNAIAGISMAGTSVFQLALAAPGLYRAIGSYSGCVRTSDPRGQLIVDAVVGGRMGNTVNMWGPPTDPAWAANDPYLHAEQLRGTAIYVSTGTGVPGPLDTFAGADGKLDQLAYQLVFGATLEAVTNVCTHQLHDRLQQLGVPSTFEFRPTGTHSWGYWEEDLHKSWKVFAAAMNE